ncbi:MAG: hypothetical protein HY880_03070, partial [Deltaproteobacteria bacterium]|nr:hypothetical protein [Deltaproteobacteria bacterium]
MDLYEKEALRNGYKIVAGLDEAGRGPLAGPVVAAAVVFSESLGGLGIKDSKKLSAGRRGEIALQIYRFSPAVGVGIVWPEVIDRTNILRASLWAMAMALSEMKKTLLSRWIGGLYSNCSTSSVSQVREFYNAIASRYSFHTEPERKAQLSAIASILPKNSLVL